MTERPDTDARTASRKPWTCSECGRKVSAFESCAACCEHQHTWSALWDDHFGKYGDQDAHFHQCFECEAMLVGPGRNCKKGCKHEVLS